MTGSRKWALRESNVFFGRDNRAFRVLADNIDETFWLTGTDGNEVFYVSPAYQRLWQQAADSLLEQPRSWSATIHRKDRAQVERSFEAYLAAPGEHAFDRQFRLNRPDGTTRHIHLRIVPVAGEAPGHLAFARDITELKQAHAALQESNEKLLRLTRHQETVNEAQRTRIARELHDELGQALTVMNLDLYWLLKHCPPDEQIRGRLGEMRELVECTARTVQDITLRLRPASLGVFGLEGALSWSIDRFRQQNEGLDCRVSIDLEGLQIDHDCSIALYRILQEALTNISRHARAGSIAIDIFHDRDTVHLRVADDGVGISGPELRRRDAWGLIGMRERVAALRGEFDIGRRPEGGTRLAVRLPLSRAEAPGGARSCEPLEPRDPGLPGNGELE